MNINDYKDRLDAPVNVEVTELMTPEMKADAEHEIKDYADFYKCKYPCMGLICERQPEGDNCAEHCPIAGYCKEGCFHGYKSDEAEQVAREIIMRGYLVR